MKPQQILDLEKAWGIKIGADRYQIDFYEQLTRLDLSGNQIKDLSLLKSLTHLTSLDLSYCIIKDLSPIYNFTQLKSLNLSGLQIKDLTLLISLTQLTSLELFGNRIVKLSPLKALTQLTNLDLNYNEIEDLSPLKALIRLTRLDLRDNKIVDLSPLKALTQLTSLDLRENNIIDLSPLKSLTQLRSLDLSYNKIKDLRPLKDLINTDLGFYRYKIYNNPLTHPPLEIVEIGSKAILNWIYEYEKAQAQNIEFKPLNEVRVIILGWGKVGKTTLRKRLIGEPVAENEIQTDGIDIDIWKPLELPDIALRVWDFGGQEIQHSIHNLFLQNNCVYVLVIDKRKDQSKNEDLVYWLEHIRSFGNDSPILIVENSIDTEKSINENSTPAEIEDIIYLSAEVARNFPYSNIDYVGVSALKGYNIETLKAKLFKLAQHQNNKGLYPPDWLLAKSEVEQSITGGFEAGGLACQNYITKETFDWECERNNVTETSAQDTLLGVMAQLGIVSYYKRSNDKSNWLILNPEWLTTAIYSILLHPTIKRLNGHLQRADVQALLSSDAENVNFFSKKHYTYSETEIGYVLDLMIDFELCFSPNNQDFYFPMGFKDNFQSQFVQKNPNAVSFFFEYDTLPKAIWYKLMVRLFKRKLISRYWGSGIELEHGDTKGLIEINTVRHKRIQIWMDGRQRIELLTLIRYELDFVHEEFNSIPVVPKVFTEKGDEIDYVDLLELFIEKKSVFKKSFGNSYDVPQLLSSIEAIEETNKRISNIERMLLQNADKQVVINNINQNYVKTDVNIENRFELPQQVNNLEGQLNFLLEELKDKTTQQAQLFEILKKIDELRLVPTKEEAKKKGFLERFKKLADYFKTGSDLAKSIETLKEYVDIEQIKAGIELILQNMQ